MWVKVKLIYLLSACIIIIHSRTFYHTLDSNRNKLTLFIIFLNIKKMCVFYLLKYAILTCSHRHFHSLHHKFHHRCIHHQAHRYQSPLYRNRQKNTFTRERKEIDTATNDLRVVCTKNEQKRPCTY